METYAGAKYSGAEIYGLETLKYSEMPSLNNEPSISLSMVSTPEPYNKWRAGLYDYPEYSKNPCDSIVGANVNTLEEQFYIASQNGYKSAGRTQASLRGVPANRYNNESEQLTENIMIKAYNEDRNTEFQEGTVMEYPDVNDEKSRYKFGHMELAPNMGKNLPGSDSVLLKERDSFIRPHKRAGATLSGYYAGNQASNTAYNNTTTPANY